MNQSSEKPTPGLAAQTSQDGFAGGRRQVNDTSHLSAMPLGRPIDLLLSRLDGVKPTDNGYRARCPVCRGTSAKVAVTASATGSVLLHCFAGCVPAEIVVAVGLRMADLFPERLRPQTEAERRAAREHLRVAGWRAALEVLAKETAVVRLAAQQLLHWQTLSEEDDARLKVAEWRIANALHVLCPPPPRFRPEVGNG